MGLDVVAISKATRVACRGGEECDETHYGVGSYRKRRDGVKPGCYIVGNGGRSRFVTYVPYAGYSAWRRQLSLLSLGVEPEEVWEHPRRFRGKPFAELIDFPDGAGPIIGPKTSAKLYADFVAFASKAKRHYQTPSIQMPAQGSKRLTAKSRRHVNRAGLSSAEEVVKALGGVMQVPEEEDRTWMWEIYLGFRRGFKLASDDGFVAFH